MTVVLSAPAVVVVPTGLPPLATVGAGLATLAAVIVVVAGGPGGGMSVVAPGVGAELAVRLQKRGGRGGEFVSYRPMDKDMAEDRNDSTRSPYLVGHDICVDGGDARRGHEGDDN